MAARLTGSLFFMNTGNGNSVEIVQKQRWIKTIFSNLIKNQTHYTSKTFYSLFFASRPILDNSILKEFYDKVWWSVRMVLLFK